MKVNIEFEEYDWEIYCDLQRVIGLDAKEELRKVILALVDKTVDETIDRWFQSESENRNVLKITREVA